jgi:hypothetical protein
MDTLFKTTPDILITIAVVWSLSLPFLPDSVFQLADTILGVFALLLTALLSLNYGPVVGILALIAVALTFVERNRRKISSKILVHEPTLERQLAPAEPMSPAEVHPNYEISHEDETFFFPEQDSSDSFKPVGNSIDEKAVSPTIGSNEGSDSAQKFFIDQHLAKTTLD